MASGETEDDRFKFSSFEFSRSFVAMSRFTVLKRVMVLRLNAEGER